MAQSHGSKAGGRLTSAPTRALPPRSFLASRPHPSSSALWRTVHPDRCATSHGGVDTGSGDKQTRSWWDSHLAEGNVKSLPLGSAELWAAQCWPQDRELYTQQAPTQAPGEVPTGMPIPKSQGTRCAHIHKPVPSMTHTHSTCVQTSTHTHIHSTPTHKMWAPQGEMNTHRSTIEQIQLERERTCAKEHVSAQAHVCPCSTRSYTHLHGRM